MLSKKLEKALNSQITIKEVSSRIYLSMAIWAEGKGLEGIATFMYAHSDEERMHMLKFIKYVNERGSQSILEKLPIPKSDFNSFKDVFESLYKHELMVSKKINDLVHLALQNKIMLPTIFCNGMWLSNWKKRL